MPRISKTAAAHQMVDGLVKHAQLCGVSLEGVTLQNFNHELDQRFDDGGVARCEHFMDLAWDYSGQFGNLGSDAFEAAQWEAAETAFEILLGMLEKGTRKE